MSQPTDPTERFKDWMNEHRLKAADVCADLHVSEQAIRNWRSSGIPPRRWEHVERYMGDWIDPSRRVGNTLSEITSEAIERMMQDQIVINPTAEQFERWDRASRIAQAPTLKEWIVAGLDKFAETDEREQQNASSIVPLRPHIHAAAGPPVFAEVTDWDGADDTVLVRINGLSMVPLLNDGEVIRMKHKRASRSPFMKKGLIYLVEYDGGYAVKRYNTRPATPEERDEEWVENGKVKVLESINPDFSEIIIKQPIEWIAWLDQSEK